MLRHAYNSIKNVSMIKGPPKNPLLVVLGATGTGKSQLAVDLAKQFNGEIINGDAMQMYDGLPIITNKITVEEQQGIPHHLLGFIPLDSEPWRVGLFKNKAGQIIKEIRSRGRLPIVVGGTHYYTQSLLFNDNLLNEQEDGEQAHAEMSNQEIAERYPILEEPTEVLLERLSKVDPSLAQHWHPKDRRKIRRSLEIFLTTGKKASDIYAEQKDNKTLHKNGALEEGFIADMAVGEASALLFWVYAESETLKERLDARVDKMVGAGLLDEAKSMEAFLREQATAGISVDRTRGIWASIGWKEFEPYLNALGSGDDSREDLQRLYEQSVEQIKASTRQYARRQVRWIRLKLIPTLSDENALDRLYLLDGTDVSQFEEAVSSPAIDITTRFLECTELLDPRQMSSAASQFLKPPTDNKPNEPFRQECELCHVVAVTQDQWQTHLRGRRHRALIKRVQKTAASCASPNPNSESVSLSDMP